MGGVNVKPLCDDAHLLVLCVQPILESGVIDLLCSLTQSESPALRVNGIWALMVRFLLPYLYSYMSYSPNNCVLFIRKIFILPFLFF